MSSVQQLLKSLEVSFTSNSNDKPFDKPSSISSCYETLLNFKCNTSDNTSSYSQHLTSKISDYAFLLSKHGFSDRTERLYEFIDKIIDQNNNNQPNTKLHHLQALEILLLLSESTSHTFNPITNNKYEINNFEMNDNSFINTNNNNTIESNNSQTINNLNNLFKAIPYTQI
eukprot:134010_1